MKQLSVILLLSCAALAQNVVAPATRAELTLNGSWSYTLNQPGGQIPTGGWNPTRAPALPLADGTASVWYQRTLFIPTSWTQPGRSFFLRLEKAAHYAAVYWNGALVGEHFGQFSPFEFDVSSALVAGQNTISIFVHKADTVYVRPNANIDQSSCPSANPDCIGNAYRSGTLTTLQRNWVGLAGDIRFSWRPTQNISDVFVQTSVRNSNVQVTVQVSQSNAQSSVQATVLDGANPVLTLPAQSLNNGSAVLSATWTNPVLWGPGQPKLYTLKTDLLDKTDLLAQSSGKIVDSSYTRFGFREVWIEGTSVYLNGQKLWMAGNYFGKLSSIRYVNDSRAQAFAFHILEASGMNTAPHHWDDPGDSWLDVADEMGILVVGSFYCDGRPMIQSHIDDTTAWINWMASTTQEWVQARRNHPSIVMWRPTDVLPPEIVKHSALATQAQQAIAAAVEAADTTRPLADGSQIASWTQRIETSSTTCDDGSAYAAALARATQPLLVKEIYGNFAPPCVPTFFNTLYQDAIQGGGVGLVGQELPLFKPIQFTLNWGSASGKGNRPPQSISPNSTDAIPEWQTRNWVATALSQQLAGLYQSNVQPNLLNTSPISGQYWMNNLPAGRTAFLSPLNPGIPQGVIVADDNTVWMVVPQAGSYQLSYSNGVEDVINNVTVNPPVPF